MTEIAAKPTANAPARRRLAWIAVPLLVLVGAIAWIVAADPLQSLGDEAPPVEGLTVERTVLDDAGIHLLVRASGSEAMTIAQVQVDSAYWTFTLNPPGTIARGATAWIDLPYPWIAGEAYTVAVLTNIGTIFAHQIAVAVPTPQPDFGQLVAQALIGAIVGILPVAIGLMFYPALRSVGRTGMNFLLAVTVGLLAFLFVDMSLEAVEFAGTSAALFQGPAMVVLAATTSFLILFAIGRWRGAPAGLALSFYIALGIGLHNLGEGLAIGAAFAAGSAGLGTVLILGFAIHNVTEGIGIAAPILKSRPPLWTFAALTLLAGFPTVIGMWLGSLAGAPQWSALALAVGAGAILQVIVEVSAYLIRSNDGRPSTLLSPPVLAGIIGGLGFMYATAALVKI
jgi:zinc transporter, ZIP family